MTQPDMFERLETVQINLPALEVILSPSPIGAIRCILQSARQVEAEPAGEVQISPRIKERLYRLPSGETFVISIRKIAQRPSGVDGVLLRNGYDLDWQGHRLLDEFHAEVQAKGLPKVAEERSLRWDGAFVFRTEKVSSDGTVDEANLGLRPPQVGALHAIGAHWSLHTHAATIVMPTGTGKTETMLSALANFVRRPMLVVVPSDALRSQTARKFLTFGLLRKLKVLAAEAPNPIVGIVTKIPKTTDALTIFESCNVIIGTMASLAAKEAEPLWPEIAKRIGALVIDEAHHVGAKRWSQFREAFAEKLVLQFTATPFRRDGVLVDGSVIFGYPLRRAQEDGYFKPITFEPVFEPVPACADRAIAEAALSTLREDLQNGFNHLMMARCSSIGRAEILHNLYMELAPDLNPLLIHSEEKDAVQRIEALLSGRSRVVVCVNMLGEGFDLPELKVAAIHDLHKSLAILLQFTGRFTRSAGDRLGNATVVANIADTNVSTALERLYSEDADWNELLSELSSDAAQDHAKLIAFLNESRRLDQGDGSEELSISHKLLKASMSSLVYEASEFHPKKMAKGLPSSFIPQAVWIHDKSNTLFFVTYSEPTLKWSRSKSIRDRIWAMFILHYDEKHELLYLSCTDHDANLEGLAKAVGAKVRITGERIFRSMGRMTRLIFQNVGVKKVGRRNLSYASYTGSEVAQALSLADKTGSVKALLSGIGWENGKQTTIGCSAKGRIWSREQGSIPRFNTWCENIGSKIVDNTIDPAKLIDNVLLPTIVTRIPDLEILTIEWPVEILRQAEQRVAFHANSIEFSQVTCELTVTGVDRPANSIDFELIEASAGVLGRFRFTLGGANEFEVTHTQFPEVAITIGKMTRPLHEYFSDYPPLFRFVDLSELDANLHITPQSPYDLELNDDQIEVWDWANVDITKESMWKGGVLRQDSIQWHVAQHYFTANFDVVFDDDASGEAADLVCIKEHDDHIQLVLIHCKFSGGQTQGQRVKDVVEVSSQAVRSARWTGRFSQLCQHLKARNESLKSEGRTTRYLKGKPADLTRLVKFSRFYPIRPEILVVQPGLSKSKRTKDQSIVLAAAATYLKETIGVDMGIIGG